jgi:hypothetical protein
MNGVEIYLAPQTQGNGTLRMHLRNGAISTSDIDTASQIQQVIVPAFYRFTFLPYDDSFQALLLFST